MVTIRSSSGMNDGEDVEHRGLAGAGAAGDEDVEPRLDAGLEELEHLRRRGAEADEVLDGERRGGELSDRDDRADEAERRNDRVDARPVGETGVDHGARLVDAAADGGDDPLDDLHDVLVVLERHVRELQPTFALDVDLLRAVDHHLGDGLVAQERLERPEAEDLVGDLLEHPHPLGAGEGEALLVGDLAEQLLDLAPHLDLVREVELRVHLVDEPVLDAVLGLTERLAGGEGSEEGAPGPADRVGEFGGVVARWALARRARGALACGAGVVGPTVAGSGRCVRARRWPPLRAVPARSS